MGRMKDRLIDLIEELSEKTGYDFDFLLDLWYECMDEGQSWDYFKGVTLELDW